MCGLGADLKRTHRKMTWKANNLHTVFESVDLAGYGKLYRKVSITGLVW